MLNSTLVNRTLAMLYFFMTTSVIAGDVTFYLPYAANTTHKLLQGYNGPWGHKGHAEFAYDFQMPIGTAVHAARAGKVVHVVEKFKDSTRKAGEENVIVIRHDDGTFARYYHLKQNGAEVEVGNYVKEKQLIGLSGDSGASAGPHLHFDVTRDCFEWGCQTIKMEFTNAKQTLVAGESY